MDRTELLPTESPYRHKWTPFLLYCNLAAVIGSSFLFGYVGVMVNEPFQIFENFMNASYGSQHNSTQFFDKDELDNLWTLTVSLFLVGGIFGALLGGPQANRWGRKKSLLINSFIGLLGGSLMFSAPFLNFFELLMVGRAISGFHCGLITGIVPVFITELAPLSLRGASGVINQISICLGGVTASILGLPVVLARADVPILWPFLFFPCALLPIVQMVMLGFAVESPRWLMLVKHDEIGAIAALEKLRGRKIPQDVIANEIAELRRDAEISAAVPKMALFDQIRGAFSWPLVICVVMQCAQQLSGINAAIFYSSKIFEQAGLEGNTPEYASLGVTGTSAVMAVVSALIVERVGRRTLMIFGIGGMWLSCALVVVFMALASSLSNSVFNYLTIVAIISYVATFGVGPGPIPWFIAPELSLPQYRAATISVCTFVNWIANLSVGIGYPPLQKALGPYSFVPFLVLLTVFFIFSLLFLPETKGKTPEESIHQLNLSYLQVRKCCSTSSSLSDQSSINI